MADTGQPSNLRRATATGSSRTNRATVSNHLPIYPHVEFDTDLGRCHAQGPVTARLQQRDQVRSSGQAADIDQAARLQPDQAIVEGVTADAVEHPTGQMYEGQASARAKRVEQQRDV